MSRSCWCALFLARSHEVGPGLRSASLWLATIARIIPARPPLSQLGGRHRSQDPSRFRRPSLEAPPSRQPTKPLRHPPCRRQEALRRKSHQPEAPPGVWPCDPLDLLARDVNPELRQPPLSQPLGSIFPPFLSSNGSAPFSRQNLLLSGCVTGRRSPPENEVGILTRQKRGKARDVYNGGEVGSGNN